MDIRKLPISESTKLSLLLHGFNDTDVFTPSDDETLRLFLTSEQYGELKGAIETLRSMMQLERYIALHR